MAKKNSAQVNSKLLSSRIKPNTFLKHKPQIKSQPSLQHNRLAKALAAPPKLQNNLQHNKLAIALGGLKKKTPKKLVPAKPVKGSKTINFKNASLPKFLVLMNLTPGTTLDDVKAIIEENVGKTKYIRTRYISALKSVKAEVVFEKSKENLLQQAVKTFNGIRSDGKILQAEIGTVPELITKTEISLLNSLL